MIAVSASDVAIVSANKNGTLRFVERESRLGGTFIALCDDKGTIEVFDTMNEAQQRVSDVSGRCA